VCIGANVLDNAGEINITRIRNIGSNPIVGGINVVITGTGLNGDLRLGYASPSRRYKKDIMPIGNGQRNIVHTQACQLSGKRGLDTCKALRSYCGSRLRRKL
jgi:hypothetical protein